MITPGRFISVDRKVWFVLYSEYQIFLVFFVDNMTVEFSAGMERKENSVDKEGPVPL